jgi:hypothetical protein
MAIKQWSWAKRLARHANELPYAQRREAHRPRERQHDEDGPAEPRAKRTGAHSKGLSSWTGLIGSGAPEWPGSLSPGTARRRRPAPPRAKDLRGRGD